MSPAEDQARDGVLDGVLDVAVVGAGFAGLHLLHTLRQQGLRVRVFETAADVGGVWNWNRYPGARCDVESLQYSYSFSSELEQEWRWSERYAAQPEILRYIQHVAERFDLRRDIQFNTRVTQATFDESTDCWTLRTEASQRRAPANALAHGHEQADAKTQGQPAPSNPPIRARFVIMATGALSAARLPEFPGQSDFKGPIHHTGQWPHEGVDFTGQRVGVIGTGSSGIQAIPVIARQAAQLVVFQRTPNFTIPAWNRPLDDEAQSAWKARYAEHRARAREVGTLYEFNDRAAANATEAERQHEYTSRWDKGGVNFVHAFNDLMVNKASNDTIAHFVREQIAATVHDPQVAAKLMPHNHPLGTKRICVDTGYFETFNQANVKLVDVRSTPIERLTATGLRTRSRRDAANVSSSSDSDACASGATTDYALDAIVCATGYDALTGALTRIDIRGTGGHSLQSQWAQGPRTYLGLMTAGFPNLFIITGPGSPSVLVNMVVGIEQHVEWITRCLADLRAAGHTRIEATVPAQDDWVAHVNAAAGRTLFPLADSWFLGANIPGKPRVFMPYVAKIGAYRKICDEVAREGYRGFVRA
jgi:cyclohexanone monooxygenase